MSVEYAAAESNRWDSKEKPVHPAPLQRSRIAPALLVVWLAVFLSTLGTGFDNHAQLASWFTAVYAVTAALIGLLIFRPMGIPGLRTRVLVYAVPVLLGCAALPFTSGIAVVAAIACLPAWALVTALYGVRRGLARGAGTAFTVVLGGIVGAGIVFGAVFLIAALLFGGHEWILVLICFLPLVQVVVPFPRSGWQEMRNRRMEMGLAVPLAFVGSGWVPLPWVDYATDAVFGSVIGGLAYVVGAFTAGAAVKRVEWAREKTAEYAPYPSQSDKSC